MSHPVAIDQSQQPLKTALCKLSVSAKKRANIEPSKGLAEKDAWRQVCPLLMTNLALLAGTKWTVSNGKQKRKKRKETKSKEA